MLYGDDPTVPVNVDAAVLIHEAFHVYQDEALPGFLANEALLFEQPVDDAEWLLARRAESECLRRAWLAFGDDDAALGWARAALDWRQRMAEAGDVTYTRGLELREGTAQYVQYRAHDERETPPLPADGYAAEDIRERGYGAGETWARLLDRAHAPWASELAPDGSVSLDEALERALEGAELAPRALSDAWLTRARARAAEDAAAVTARREARLGEFLGRSGASLVLQPLHGPLWVERFDPLNLEPLSAGQVLHTRWLRAARGEQRIECEDLDVLSLPAGGHPLFEGVAGLVLTGLEAVPEVVVEGDVTRLRAPGLSVDLMGAEVQTRGDRLIVTF